MINPLIEKYNELYKPKVEEPNPEPKPSYPQENRVAIRAIELLLEDLKTGRAIYQDSKIEPNYKYMPPVNPFDMDYNQPFIVQRYLSTQQGELITFKLFRRYR